jgi:glutamate N-acetyltransferase / amino-acid N-acetyltransferase
MMQYIDGGVTAPEGFFATGTSCGLKGNNEKDIAIVCSEDSAAAAGIFTRNVIKGHSLQVTMEHIKSGYATAVIINSGNANACIGEQGYKDAKKIAQTASRFLECNEEDILVGSTGVIGKPLNMDLIIPAIDKLVTNMVPEGGHDAAEAIMTTDTVSKEAAVEFDLQGEKVVIGGMAKGSGMIHPNMATMISVITTDVNISRSLLHKALIEASSFTFNRISVDGETSVCDMAVILANGLADNEGIVTEDNNYKTFVKALYVVCNKLSKMIVKDGEGASKLIEINVEGAPTKDDAYKAVSSIAKSPLFKTSIHGADANWGRIITALGYSGASFKTDKVNISFGNLMVCNNSISVNFDEEEAKKILGKEEIKIHINLNSGNFSDKMWTCDLTGNYVKINANYRT